jgi:hypothetical protein
LIAVEDFDKDCTPSNNKLRMNKRIVFTEERNGGKEWNNLFDRYSSKVHVRKQMSKKAKVSRQSYDGRIGSKMSEGPKEPRTDRKTYLPYYFFTHEGLGGQDHDDYTQTPKVRQRLVSEDLFTPKKHEKTVKKKYRDEDSNCLFQNVVSFYPKLDVDSTQGKEENATKSKQMAKQGE